MCCAKIVLPFWPQKLFPYCFTTVFWLEKYALLFVFQGVFFTSVAAASDDAWENSWSNATLEMPRCLTYVPLIVFLKHSYTFGEGVSAIYILEKHYDWLDSWKNMLRTEDLSVKQHFRDIISSYFPTSDQRVLASSSILKNGCTCMQITYLCR